MAILNLELIFPFQKDLALVIKPNQKILRAFPEAERYYRDLRKFLVSIGYTKVAFRTYSVDRIPAMNPALYVGHLEGNRMVKWLPADRVSRFATLNDEVAHSASFILTEQQKKILRGFSHDTTGAFNT